ncbi:MAG: MFS transporter [Phycisphaeraceae bacterium]
MTDASQPLLARRVDVPLWRNISFVLMWSSVAASGFGDRMIQIVAWTMLGINEPDADAASVQAGIYFFFFLPYLIFSPLGGWLADTLPRKWIMFGCDEGRALILLLAFLLVPAGAARAIPEDYVLFNLAGFAFPGRWAVYGIILGVGTMAAVFNPTRNAVVPQIVPTPHLQAANAIILGLAVVASLIGMGVGGWVIDALDSLQAGLFLAVGSFAVSGSFFIFLRVRQHKPSVVPPPTNQLYRLLQGASYIRRHRPILQLVILGVLFWASANLLMAAVAALNASYYDLPSPLITWLIDVGGGGSDDRALVMHIAVMGMVLGLGMLISAIVVSLFNTRRETPLVMMSCLLLAGLSMLALGLVHAFEWGLVFAFCSGFFGNAALVYVNSQTQSVCPNYIRGRVFGVREIFGTISSLVVNFTIWRLPGADEVMVPALYGLAALFLVGAFYGFYRIFRQGPMPTAAANALWRLCRTYVLIWHRLEWRGRQHLPDAGPVILASNHTTAIDPLLIQAACPRVVRWVMSERFRFRLLEPLWRTIHPITIDPQRAGASKIRQIVDALKQGDMVGLFPEGGLQREKRDLNRLQPGVVRIAQRSGAVIVPVWIEGTPRRKWMLLHFLQPSRSRITFGAPFTVDDDAEQERVLEELRQRLTVLSDREA